MDSSDQKNLSRPGTSLDIQPRRSEARDSQEAFKLVQSYTTDVFGRVNRVENIALILEHAVFALSLADSYDNLFALAAFYDYPNIHNVSQSDWDQTWWNDTFKIPDVNAINTLFLHLFVAHPDYSEGCAKEVINAAFKTLPEVNQILLCVPNNVQPEIALSKYFTPISTKHDKSDSLSTVFGCYRKDHFPSLFIRTARVQDNDDLAPLFNQYNDILKQTYGDYFVAELIESQDDDNKAFVAEADGYAVGFMSVSKEVNINVLNEVYQLAAFHGLREAHSDDVWNEESGNNPTIDDQFSSIDATAVYEDAKGNSFIEQSSDTLENRRVSDMHQTTTDNNRLNNFKRQTTADEGKENRISLDSDLEIDNKAENENDHAITDQTVNNTDVQLIDTSAYRAKMTKAQLAAEDPSKFIRPSIASTAPKFFGRPKAFAIQLFCINELYEKRSYDFLKKAFDSFPDRDYCIISIPHMVPEFPLLHSFIRIPPRINLPNIQELYMFHRAGLLRNIEIKKATEDNLETIKKFVQHLSSREYIIQDFLEAVRSRKRRDNGSFVDAYIIYVANQTSALVLFSNEENVDYLRSQYNLEDFIYFNLHKRYNHLHLYHFIINPVFAYLTRIFIKELLRKIHKTCVYYPIYPRYADDELLKKHSSTHSMHYMVPVRPRKLVQYNLEKLQLNAPTESVLGLTPELVGNPFALNFTDVKLIMEPKITINARIVIVGGSTTALAVLETLAMCPYLRFNNLTLISPHGLPGELPPSQLRQLFLPSNLEYDINELARISLRSYVNIICAKLKAINRPMKLAILNDETVVPYDHLLMCTGNQFRVIAPMQAKVISPLTKKVVTPKPDRELPDPIPTNVLTINDDFDAAMTIRWLKTKKSNKQSIIVYGSTLESYCCINALIANGIQSDSITFIFPPDRDNVSCFNDPYVLDAVHEQLNQLNVKIYEDYIMDAWFSEDDNGSSKIIERIVFRSQTEGNKSTDLNLECTALFCYYNKRVDYDAFVATNQSSLVFDGRLVIDATYRTNDPHIYAGGPLTKYKRSYHCDDWSHACFNSKEVGVKLANELLELYDPTFPTSKRPDTANSTHSLIPSYTHPKRCCAVLPGNLHYLQISKPGITADYNIAKTITDTYGIDLATNLNQNYFRIHLDQNHIVRTIVCLSHQDIDVYNISHLYGLHERLLNNLLQRYNEGLIPDFFSYFKQNWTVAIYHDRFADVRLEIRDILKQTLVENSESLFSSLHNSVDHDILFNAEQKKVLLKRFQTEGYKEQVEEKILHYINYNHYHLPMYAKPDSFN